MLKFVDRNEPIDWDWEFYKKALSDLRYARERADVLEQIRLLREIRVMHKKLGLEENDRDVDYNSTGVKSS